MSHGGGKDVVDERGVKYIFVALAPSRDPRPVGTSPNMMVSRTTILYTNRTSLLFERNRLHPGLIGIKMFLKRLFGYL